MLRLTPSYNYSLEWHHCKDIWAKGDAYNEKGELLSAELLALLFSEITSKNKIVEIVSKLNGLFCIMGNSEFGGFAIVDRIRSLPLFFTTQGDDLFVSDSPYSIVSSAEVDDFSAKSFKTAGYCIKDKTLIKNIFQVEAGSIVFFDDSKTQKVFYYSHSSPEVRDISYEDAKAELKIVLNRIMHRVVNNAAGKTIAIPLSGGYDSRFILTWLVMNGYSNIQTFTYGRSGSLEIEFAKRVAGILGIDWTPIVYDYQMMKGITNDVYFKSYIPFASLACSMPFFQDYPAMHQLKTKEILPSDTIIVPGHSGDFIAGSHLFPLFKDMTKREIPTRIITSHHSLLPALRNEKLRIKNEVIQFVNSVSKNIPYTILEDWDYRERQAKFIVNSTRTYQFFGYDLRLPFFDNEFVEFFRQMPFEYKLAKRLYRETLEDYYFKPSGLLFEDEMQATLNELKLQQYKDFLKIKIPFLKKLVRKPADNNCYSEIAFQLFTETGITQNISLGSKNTNAPIVEWYLKYFEVKIGEWLLQENKI